VGETAPRQLSGRSFGHFEGEVSTEAASGAGYHTEGSYYVGHSYYGQEWADDVLSSIYDASGGRTDLVAIVNAVKAKHLVHMSLFGYSAKKLSVEGDLYLLTDVRSGEAQR
jgi:hypothetical protein